MSDSESRKLWDASFRAQIEDHAYNTAPVEALARNVSYYLRGRSGGSRPLHFLELGSGGGANLIWLAARGLDVSAVDISRVALDLARRNLDAAGCAGRARDLLESSVSSIPFLDASFDGVVEACVFQHLNISDRRAAFAEVKRVLKPGGLFSGYMLADDHSVYLRRRGEELADDPGTLMLDSGATPYDLSGLGVSHFFNRSEITALLSGFAEADPCALKYELPKFEARKRGYDSYVQSMWAVYAIR